MGDAVRFSRGVIGAVVVWLGLLAAPALAADAIALRFEVYGLAGLHVLSLKSNIDDDGGRYTLNVDYATTGVAGLFVDVKTHAQVRGRLNQTAVQPEAFQKDTRHNGEERHNKVDYLPDGNVVGASTPALPQPIPASAGRGTVDNLTAYFLLERQLARTGSCALSVAVFDGRYRYDLFFSDAGTKTLPYGGGQRFEGATKACRMQRRNISTGSDPEQDEGARQGTIWYAKLIPGDLMVPVRMELETQIGGVTAYLAELHGRGVDLKLME
jgi:uncharacterized protein DUF3108